MLYISFFRIFAKIIINHVSKWLNITLQKKRKGGCLQKSCEPSNDG